MMSFEPSPLDEDISTMEVATIPWEHRVGLGGSLTINLALYCLVLLAHEGHDILQDYDSLDNGQQ